MSLSDGQKPGSQDGLAQRASVFRQKNSRIERAEGDVGVDVVDSIANAFGTPIAELFVPAVRSLVGDDELARRAGASADDLIDARELLTAIDESQALDLYSRAGRPVKHGSRILQDCSSDGMLVL